jgi:hypothetical protein
LRIEGFTGSVLRTPRAILHTIPVSLAHSVASAEVKPALARTQYSLMPNPVPDTENTAPPGTAWFALPTRVIDGTSYDTA